jgi:hypothetical protein
MKRSVGSVSSVAGVLLIVLAGCGNSAARPSLGQTSQPAVTTAAPPATAAPATSVAPAPDVPADVALPDPATPADTKVLLSNVDQVVADADNVLANG